MRAMDMELPPAKQTAGQIG